MVIVDKDKCVGCKMCEKDCFVKAIEVTGDKAEFTKPDSCFKCGHCVAVCPKNAVSMDEYNMDEVKEYKKESFNIDPDVLLNFIKFRRSTRQFKDKDVDNEMLKKIVEAGRFTQTGTNAQNVSYVVIKDKLAEVKKLAFATLKGAGEHILANLSDETMYLKRYAEMWINMSNAYEADPVKNDSLFFNAPSVILIMSDSPLNAGLASSNMELMVNALGLGTFFSGFFTIALEKNPEIKKVLGVEADKNVVSCMVIGHPSVKYSRTVPRFEADIKWS